MTKGQTNQKHKNLLLFENKFVRISNSNCVDDIENQSKILQNFSTLPNTLMDLEHFMLILRALRSNHDPIFCPPELSEEKVLDFCSTLISILSVHFDNCHFRNVSLRRFCKPGKRSTCV